MSKLPHRLTCMALLMLMTALCHATAQDTTTFRHDCWLADVCDTARIADLFIPGTHDSCTGGKRKALAFAWQTQEYDIKTQLEAGVRFLDVRLNGNMHTAHGRAEFDETFGDVMNDICDFLDSHPTEFVICLIKQEDRDLSAGDTDFQIKISDIINTWQIHDKTYHGSLHDMRLHDVRGKIIFLNRSFSDVKNKVETWHGHDYEVINDIICVQDNYKAGIKRKMTLVEQFYDKYDRRDIIGINFNTIPGTGLIPNPRKASKTLNRHLSELIDRKGRTMRGIIVLDFGENLYDKIIECNFRYRLGIE